MKQLVVTLIDDANSIQPVTGTALELAVDYVAHMPEEQFAVSDLPFPALTTYELVDYLIIRLRETNGLEFCPPEQRAELIKLLAADVEYVE